MSDTMSYCQSECDLPLFRESPAGVCLNDSFCSEVLNDDVVAGAIPKTASARSSSITGDGEEWKN